MKKERAGLYRTALQGIRCLYIVVIAIEIITYTVSFLISGLAKKDIFNVLEGTDTTFGINSIWVLILLNTLIPLGINCVKQMNAALVAKLTVRLKKNVKQNLLTRVLQRKIGMKGLKSDGEFISLFRNESEDVSTYFLEFYYHLPKIALSIAILVMMFYINPMFAFVSIIPTVIIVILLRFLNRHITYNRESARKETEELTEYVETVLGNIEYFKMSNCKEYIYMNFHERCRRRSASEIRDRVLDRAIGSLSENSANLTLGVVLLLAIPLFRTGLFTVGEFVMFEYYYAFLASLPDAVGALIKRRKQTNVSIDRLQRAWETRVSDADGIESQGKVLGVNRDAYQKEDFGTGSVTYNGKNLEISVEGMEQPLTFYARKGQIILLEAQDGRNRSELLQRLYRICNNSLLMRCAYVPKEPILLEESVLENICMGETCRKDKLMRVLEQTDLAKDVESFTEGILKNVGKKGSLVSGGQRKRIAIARALYTDAEILFIDGITDQVDRETEVHMISQMMSEFEGILFTTTNSRQLAQQVEIATK